jgi:diguanylate cyclase (GGDEF)-like protein/PAS domain S-box-containing protein
MAVVARLGFEAKPSGPLHAALLDAVGQSVIATDLTGEIIYWNRPAELMYGWSADEAIGRAIIDLLPSRHSAERAAGLLTLLTEGVGWTKDLTMQHRDGHEFPALVTATPVLDADGVLIGTISVATDISERKQAEDVMRHLSAIVESSGDSVIGKLVTGEIVSWNRAAEDLFGYPAGEAIGQHISLLAPEDKADELRAILAQVAAGHIVRGLETVRRRRDGTTVEVSLTISPTFKPDGEVAGASVIARDITERRAMEDAIEHNALHDALTGLPNRALLADRLSQALVTADREDRPVAVLFLDLDQFKTINDAAGHAVGDQVLVEVARRLQSALRAGDTVARFAGDTFVIVCNDSNENTAEQVAARLQDSLVDPIAVDGPPMYVTASVGIAVSPPMDSDALLSHADAAMYDAKARGRSRSRVFDVAMAQNAQDRLQMSNDLSQALQQGALELWYQPIVDLTTGEMLGVEALCRWNHPELGMVPPTNFVAVAESTGLVRELDEWVLHRACQDARVLSDQGVLGADGYVGVNVSAQNVADVGLRECIRSAVREAGIRYDRLALEVTETGMMTEPEGARRVFDELRSLGVAIALDDFGTGYSSLTYLHRFPVTTLKIDQTFVRHITENRDDLAIVVSIIDLARSAQLETVAEGVETLDQLELLRKMGCRAGQGYLWSPAVPRDRLIAIVGELPDGRFRLADGTKSSTRHHPPAFEVTIEHGLKQLMDMHFVGASLDTIAANLNKTGFRTPSGLRWHRSTVARVVADTVYPRLIGATTAHDTQG